MATNNATNTSNPVTVPQGGTGDASLTAYAVLTGGTTSTAPVQSVSGVGTAGQVLQSNGASALPTWTTAATTGAWTLIRTATASASANITFTSSDITGFSEYVVIFNSINNATGSVILNMDWSTNNGSSYLGSGYTSGVLSNAYNSATFANNNSTSTSPLTPTITNTSSMINGTIFFNLPASAVASYTGRVFIGDGTATYAEGYGRNSGTTTINNMRFQYSSGNITSGAISLYGVTV